MNTERTGVRFRYSVFMSVQTYAAHRALPGAPIVGETQDTEGLQADIRTKAEVFLQHGRWEASVTSTEFIGAESISSLSSHPCPRSLCDLGHNTPILSVADTCVISMRWWASPAGSNRE